MSKSLFIEYRGQGFWAFDVVASVLLKHLVDVAAARESATPWLSEILQHWRVQTFLAGQLGLKLDETWSDAQVDVVIGMIEAACNVIETRSEIPADEIENWELLDGNRLFARGLPFVRSKAVTNLARAIILLLKGTLPSARAGTWWWYGVEDEPETIKKGTSD